MFALIFAGQTPGGALGEAGDISSFVLVYREAPRCQGLFNLLKHDLYFLGGLCKKDKIVDED